MYFLWDSSFSPEKNPAVTCLERWACGWCSGGPVPSPLTSTFSTSWVCCLSSISPKNKPLVCLEVGMWDALWFGCIKWAQWLCFPSWFPSPSFMELVLPRAELRVVLQLALVSAASFTEFAAYSLLPFFPPLFSKSVDTFICWCLLSVAFILVS